MLYHCMVLQTVEMIVLNARWGGLIARCPNCYAILGYRPEDVSESQNIRCPQCGFNLWVPLNVTYDGIIKENENGETTVSGQSGTGTNNS